MAARDVISFRPTDEEKALIERTRRSLGVESRAEAVRWLLRRGGERAGSLADDPVFKYRLPARFRRKRTWTSEEIDEKLYGGGP